MRKGFTLIELLIVIGILAILATTVVLVLNPAQILAESRDTQRVSDLGALNSAIGLYLATAASIDLSLNTSNGDCIGETGSPTDNPDQYWATISGITTPFTGPFDATTPQNGSTGRSVGGLGWVPINMSAISGGSPLAALPVDPTNSGTDLTTGGLFYAYTCAGNTYEINAAMESKKFANLGGSDVESTDGGSNNDIYEIGTDPGLDL